MQRKPTKNTRGPNAEEKRFQRWIKESDQCGACGANTAVICHHAQGATFRHLKVLVGHWFCIGLCQECDDIVTFGSRREFRDVFGPQSEIWLDTVRKSGFEPPKDVVNAIGDWGR